MKNGYIEASDADRLMEIYKKIDLYGNLKEPFTTDEQVLIFCIAESIKKTYKDGDSEMTESEAIKEIRNEVCNEKGVSKLCHDHCMYGKEKCAYSMAINALEEVQKYRELGTIEELKTLRDGK